MESFLFVFLCSLVAAAGTAVGGLVVFLPCAASPELGPRANGLAVGVMLFLAHFGLIPNSLRSLSPFSAAFCFLSGFAFFAWLQRRVLPPPSEELPLPSSSFDSSSRRVWTTALFTTLLLAAHNLVEGLAILFSNSQDRQLGLYTTLDITFHNIFEGAVPALGMLAASRSRWEAFSIAALSGWSEPFAVVVGHVLLGPLLNAEIVAASLAVVAGVMTSLCLFELLPLASTSKSYQVWVCGGMALAALPLLLL